MTATTHLDARTPIMTLRSLETPLPENSSFLFTEPDPREPLWVLWKIIVYYCIIILFL